MEPGAARRANERDKDARAICLCKALPAGDPGVPVPRPARGTGFMSPLLPGAPAAPRLPPSQHPEGLWGERNGGGQEVLM